MRIHFISAAFCAAFAIPAAATPPPTASEQQIALLTRPDAIPRDRGDRIQIEAPAMRVDRPIVRARRTDARDLVRRELASVAF